MDKDLINWNISLSLTLTGRKKQLAEWQNKTSG